MIIPLVVAAEWLLSAVLFRLSGHDVSSLFAAALTPVPVLLAILLRRIATGIAALKVIEHRDKGGPPPQITAADLPGWPIRIMTLLALGGIFAIGAAIWALARAPGPTAG